MFKALNFILLFFGLILSGSVNAAVTTIQALSFGEFLFLDNTAQRDITINPNGSYSHDPEFIEITPPQEGIYDIDGVLPGGTAVTSVTITQVAPLWAGGRSFQILNFQETHWNISDPSGVVRVFVGATARSTGDSSVYPDNTYNGTLNIQINF